MTSLPHPTTCRCTDCLIHAGAKFLRERREARYRIPQDQFPPVVVELEALEENLP